MFVDSKMGHNSIFGSATVMVMLWLVKATDTAQLCFKKKKKKKILLAISGIFQMYLSCFQQMEFAQLSSTATVERLEKIKGVAH